MQDRHDRLRNRLRSVRRERQQGGNHHVRRSALVRRRSQNGGFHVQQWAMRDTARHRLRERLVQRGGNGLSRVRHRRNGVRRIVLRGRARLLRQRMCRSRHH